MLVPILNGTIQVCLNLTRLNKALIRQVHRGPTVSDIFSKLKNECYLTLIDGSSGYPKPKLDKKCLPKFSCHFGRYRYTRLPFRAAPAGYVFHHKIDGLFKELPNVFGNEDDILVVGYVTVAEIMTTLRWVVLIFHNENIKLNKNQCHFWCMRVPLFDKIISRHGVQPDPKSSACIYWYTTSR